MIPRRPRAWHWQPLVLALILFGCGDGVAPSVSSISLTATSIELGQPLYATIHVAAPDGHLPGGQVEITVTSAGEGDIELEDVQVIYGVTPNTRNVDLVVGIRLLGDLPGGDYLLSLVVVDEQGRESAPSSAVFALVR